MSGLISKISIESYRGIDNLELNDLQQINILTGDNNSGKTSILEAVSIFGQPDTFLSWINVSRGEKIARGFSFYERFNDFFNVNYAKKKVKYIIETEAGSSKIEMTAADSEFQITKKVYDQKAGYLLSYADEQDIEEDSLILVPGIFLEIWIDGEKTEDMILYEGQWTIPQSVRKPKEKFSRHVVYVRPFDHVRARFFLNDILNTPALYQEILDILKEFDPGILSINYDDGGSPGRSGYKILSKKNNRALPLDMYGDGMKKAILLMSAVVKAKNGVLLLDEFETAIHTSAMEHVFKWILETCCKLNVQVFLTSHSEEAINKVLNCSEELQEHMAVYTLYKDEEGNSVRRLNARKAVDVKENMGLELR